MAEDLVVGQDQMVEDLEVDQGHLVVVDTEKAVDPVLPVDLEVEVDQKMGQGLDLMVGVNLVQIV